MRKVEFVQSAYNGGFPADNGAGFPHGEPLWLVSKLEYRAMLERIRTLATCAAQEVEGALFEISNIVDEELNGPPEGK